LASERAVDKLLASYEAVSTIVKVQDLGIRFIKLTENYLIRINNLLRRNYTSWDSESYNQEVAVTV